MDADADPLFSWMCVCCWWLPAGLLVWGLLVAMLHLHFQVFMLVYCCWSCPPLHGGAVCVCLETLLARPTRSISQASLKMLQALLSRGSVQQQQQADKRSDGTSCTWASISSRLRGWVSSGFVYYRRPVLLGWWGDLVWCRVLCRVLLRASA